MQNNNDQKNQKIIHCFCDLFFSLVPDSAVEDLQPPSLDLSWPAIRSFNLTRATTTSIPLGPDLISSTLPAPVCNGNSYGFDLNIASCHGAWILIPRDTIARTFGVRGNGILDILTPLLFMGCKQVFMSMPVASPTSFNDMRT